MHDLMRTYPLATIVTSDLDANPIPVLLDAAASPNGTLLGHVARGNELWRHADEQVLAIFHGPDAYITPNWYETKKETGKVVPTWNYLTVHAYGRLIVHDDRSWIRGQIGRLTTTHEASSPQPWSVEDAPPEYIDGLVQAIVGIEIPIERLVGKFKASQNQPERNKAGVVAGLIVSPAQHGRFGLVQ